jgi:hypothetical protein
VFAEYLNSDNNIIKLSGIKIIAQLSPVDSKHKFENIFDKFYSFISDPKMTTAASVCKGSAVIVQTKPYLKEKIVTQLLKVSKTTYKTEDYKSILIGHVIVSFGKIFKQLNDIDSVMDFVKKNSNSPWKATKSKAEKFLKKY